MTYLICGSARHLKLPSYKTEHACLQEHELYVKILESVEGKDLQIISGIQTPEDLMETIFFISAARRWKAKKIDVLLTYAGYRQDTELETGECARAAVVERLLKFPQTNIQVINVPTYTNFKQLDCSGIIAKQLKKIKNAVIVSIEEASQELAEVVAKKTKNKFVVLERRTVGKDTFLIVQQKKDVEGKNIIIVTNSIISAKTILTTTKELEKNNVKSVFVASVHGVLTENARQRLENSTIKKVYLTTTLPVKPSKAVEIIPIEPLIKKEFS